MRAYGRNIGLPWSAYNEGRAVNGRPARHDKRDKRVRYYGRDLISYTTTVACYAPDKRYCLVSARYRSYSVSTTSHINSCTSFVTVPLFDVPLIDPRNAAEHVANFNHLWGKVIAVAANACRNWNPERSYHAQWVAERWRDDLAKAHAHACLYASLCKVPGKRQPLHILMNATEAERSTRLQRYNEPKEVARRARTHARYIAKKALGLS